MRNLAQYPVTFDEIVDFLDKQSKELSEEQRMGDMRPLLLKEAAKFMRTAKESGLTYQFDI